MYLTQSFFGFILHIIYNQIPLLSQKALLQLVCSNQNSREVFKLHYFNKFLFKKQIY